MLGLVNISVSCHLDVPTCEKHYVHNISYVGLKNFRLRLLKIKKHFPVLLQLNQTGKNMRKVYS